MGFAEENARRPSEILGGPHTHQVLIMQALGRAGLQQFPSENPKAAVISDPQPDGEAFSLPLLLGTPPLSVAPRTGMSAERCPPAWRVTENGRNSEDWLADFSASVCQVPGGERQFWRGLSGHPKRGPEHAACEAPQAVPSVYRSSPEWDRCRFAHASFPSLGHSLRPCFP